MNTDVDETVSIDDFWNGVEEESKGSSITITKVEIRWGIKLYAAGLTQEETWFPWVQADKSSREAVKRKVNEFVLNNKLDTRVQPSLMLKFNRRDVLNKDTSKWAKDEKVQFVQLWWDSFKSTIGPALHASGVTEGEYWCAIKWERDTSKQKQVYKDGALVFDENGEKVMENPLFFYVSKVYSSKEEAMEDVGSSFVDNSNISQSTSEESVEYPSGYNADDWAIIAAEIKSAKAGGASLTQLAHDFELELKWITKAINS